MIIIVIAVSLLPLDIYKFTALCCVDAGCVVVMCPSATASDVVVARRAVVADCRVM